MTEERFATMGHGVYDGRFVCRFCAGGFNPWTGKPCEACGGTALNRNGTHRLSEDDICRLSRQRYEPGAPGFDC